MKRLKQPIFSDSGDIAIQESQFESRNVQYRDDPFSESARIQGTLWLCQQFAIENGH